MHAIEMGQKFPPTLQPTLLHNKHLSYIRLNEISSNLNWRKLLSIEMGVLDFSNYRKDEISYKPVYSKFVQVKIFINAIKNAWEKLVLLKKYVFFMY